MALYIYLCMYEIGIPVDKFVFRARNLKKEKNACVHV